MRGASWVEGSDANRLALRSREVRVVRLVRDEGAREEREHDERLSEAREGRVRCSRRTWGSWED